MKDLASNIKIVTLTDPYDHGTGDTAIVSAIVDLQGYNSCVLNMAWGSIADADVAFTVLLEEGDASNLSDAAAVADADMIGTEAGMTPLFSDDNKNYKLGYVGSKRYIRLTTTPANNTGAMLVSGVAVLGDLNIAPNSTQGV